MDKLVNGSKYLWSKTNRFHKVLFVFVLLRMQPFELNKYGFYCNDPALSHKFKGDTIDFKWLLGVSILLPFVVMLLVERFYNKTNKEKRKKVLNWYKEYLFGFLINLCIVNILKDLVRSPRPHFFDTCKPNEAVMCKESDFVSKYTCSLSKWLWESDKSFPSGHSSLGIYAGFFIAYYLQKRTPCGPLVRAGQAVSVTLAIWCAISRIIDHRHHWWDVLSGSLLGIAVLIYTTQHLCRKFETSIEKSTSASNGENKPLVDTVTE